MASVDLFPNEEAQANVIVTKLESWVEQNEEVGFMDQSGKAGALILNLKLLFTIYMLIFFVACLL